MIDSSASHFRHAEPGGTLNMALLPKPISLLGAVMHPWSMEQTIGEISRRINSGEFTQHVVVNVAKVVNMRDNRDLREAVLGCDIVNIDGMGVVWGARMLGFDVPERVAGIDLFFRLLAVSQEDHHSVFFLGAEKHVVDQVVSLMRTSYPSLRVAGWHHGYFGDDEVAVVREIANSAADLLFVAISSPKKEQFIHRWRDQLGVKFAMGVGGTFDIVAGKTRRAPSWMQRSGFEWVYRVIQEPGRMWKRYLVTNTVFAWILLVAWVKRKKGGGAK